MKKRTPFQEAARGHVGTQAFRLWPLLWCEGLNVNHNPYSTGTLSVRRWRCYLALVNVCRCFILRSRINPVDGFGQGCTGRQEWDQVPELRELLHEGISDSHRSLHHAECSGQPVRNSIALFRSYPGIIRTIQYTWTRGFLNMPIVISIYFNLGVLFFF